jgi:HPt (histidine-containing phosphotransfer) domain-containing protein
MSASDAQTALAAALDRMWAQFLPQIQERIEVLEKSAQSFADGRLTIEQHEIASAAAHKLAGVLGTFGLTRGTVLARELEIMYSRENGPDPELAERLAATAVELRSMIETRK